MGLGEGNDVAGIIALDVAVVTVRPPAQTGGTTDSLLQLRGGALRHERGLPALRRLRGGEAVAAATSGLLGTAAALTKNIMGIGVMTLAAGMAAGTGVGPATLAMAATTLTAAHSFTLLGDACERTGLGVACSFEQLWALTLGTRTEWLVNAAIGSLTFALCAVYLICLGELLPPLLTLVRAPRAVRSRRGAVALAAAITFPLCLPSSLAGLSFISLLGVGAIGFTAAFSLLRCFDGSYAPSGRYHDAMPRELRANFEGVRRWKLSEQSAVLLANLGVALCAHFNAPAFYRALAGATAKRFRLMAYGAFGFVFVLSLLIAHPGYYTFGASCQPLILNNYHPTDDGLATAARAATAASLCCSFPLAFAALREAVLAASAPLLGRGLSSAGGGSGGGWWLATLLLPSAALTLALLVDDLGLAVGLLGSVLGGAIMYVAPAAMHAMLLLRGPPSTGDTSSTWLALAVDGALLLYGVLGQMIAGTVITYREAQQRKRGGPAV